MNVEDNNYMTLGEASRELRVAPVSVLHHVRQGRVDFISTPLGRLYSRDDVLALKRRIDARRRKRQAPLKERA
jgi:DNA-binding transcriptional MerR regulator